MSVGGRPPDGGSLRPHLRRELGIWLAVLAYYVALTSIDWPGRRQTAIANSRGLYQIERSLNIDIELALNQWLLPRGMLRTLANYEYALTYVVSSLVLLIWLYRRRPATYRWARTSFILMNVVSLLCFAVYPVAPPRLVPDLGFVDTVVVDRTWGSWGSPLVEHANQLAAMPSLHIGWALWVSLVLATIASGTLVQAASGVHVLVTLLVIMATANHYLIDAAGGVLVAVAPVAFARPRADGSTRWDAAAETLRRKVAPPDVVPQVGGLVLLDTGLPPDHTAWDGQVREAVEAVVRTRINELPKLRQRHSRFSPWQRRRWVEHPDLDWSWHVSESTQPFLDGAESLRALAAQVASTPLPADRPPWRLLVVPGRRGHHSAVIMVAHEAVADGLDAIADSLAAPRPPSRSPGWTSHPRHLDHRQEPIG